MSKRRKHVALTADHAVRLALGAFYNASASQHEDGPALVGAWMLELSMKLREDDITGPHYVEIIDRWGLEENLSAGEQFAIPRSLPDTGVTTGAR